MQDTEREYLEDHRSPLGACVEHTVRVHSDGRRDRVALVLQRNSEGVYLPVAPGALRGELARFALYGMGIAIEELGRSKRPNRLDAMGSVAGPRRRR